MDTTTTQSRGIEAKALLAQVKQGVASIYQSGAWREALLYNAKFWNYSFGNQLLIVMQKPTASRVAGFQTWKAQGRMVKKGEKGLAILRPMFLGQASGKANVIDTANNNAVIGTVDKKQGFGLKGFAVTYVFDISQTDGKAVPDYIHKLKGAAPAGLVAALKAFALGQGVSVRYDAMKASTGGFVHKSLLGTGPAEIVLNVANDEAQQAKTLIHELGHFMAGHLEKRGQDLTQEARELEAESTAFIVGTALGVDFSEYSFGYLANWAASMEAEARDKALEKAGTLAASIAKKILEGIGQAEKLA